MLEELLAQLKQQQANNPEAGTEAALELNWESLDAASQNLAALISLFALAPIPLSLLESAANASNLEMDVAVGCTALVERYLLQQVEIPPNPPLEGGNRIGGEIPPNPPSEG
jgi:hypothetical protein